MLDRIRRGGDGLGGEISLTGIEGRQDVVNRLAPTANPNAEPREDVTTEDVNDVAQAVVTASRAGPPEPDQSTGPYLQGTNSLCPKRSLAVFSPEAALKTAS